MYKVDLDMVVAYDEKVSAYLTVGFQNICRCPYFFKMNFTHHKKKLMHILFLAKVLAT